LGGSIRGKTIGILGLTFKPNTDDMRESPALEIVPALIAAGARVQAYDPEGMTEARKLLQGPTWCGSAYDAIAGADALVVVTEWNEFRALDPERIKSLMRGKVVVDLRNVYSPAEMQAAGLDYSSIGRP
jgi:UDPglucose 6-dehydrogenase